jgi:hypothetical protein
MLSQRGVSIGFLKSSEWSSNCFYLTLLYIVVIFVVTHPSLVALEHDASLDCCASVTHLIVVICERGFFKFWHPASYYCGSGAEEKMMQLSVRGKSFRMRIGTIQSR